MHTIRHPLPGRRGAALGAALAAALLLPPAASAAAPQICGCEKRGSYTWAEHLTLWSNMVSAVRNVKENYAEARAAIAATRGDWDAADEKFDDVSSAADKAAALNERARELQGQVGTYVAQDAPEKLALLVPNLEKLVDDLLAGRKAWSDLDAESFSSSLGRAARDEEKHRKTFAEHRRGFDDWYAKADDLRFGAISLPCVQSEWRNIEAFKAELARAADSFDRGREDAVRRRDDLAKKQKAVEDSFKDVDNKLSGIGRELGLPANADPKTILETIRDRTVKRATVRFFNVPEPMHTLSLKIGIDEIKRPANPAARGGPGFLYWRERSKGGPFSDWGEKASRDLDLEAVWGYTVSVMGFEDDLSFPVEGWQDSVPVAYVLADPKLKARADELRARNEDPGRVFDGWATSAEPDVRLGDRSGDLRNYTKLLPLWKKAEYRITWVVPGGTPPPPTTWTYEAAGPFPVPPPLPEAGANGFHYVRWSLDENGAEEWGGGTAITNNLTVFAVREADYKVLFRDEDGAPLPDGERGAKKGEEFGLYAAPKPPAKPGKTFVEWRLKDGSAFLGGALRGDMEVFAEYRPETKEEAIRRLLAPITGRFPLPLLAVADAALLVVLVVLLFTGGGGSGRSKKKKKAGATAAGDEGKAGGAEAAAV